MRYWVIIALACLASASDLPKGEKDTSSSSVEELGSRFGSSGIGESLLKVLKKISHPSHDDHLHRHTDLTTSKNKGNIIDILKLDVNRGRGSKREHNEILDLLKLLAVVGKDSLGKQEDILKNVFGLNTGNTFQNGQRGLDSDINLDKILKQGLNFQQGSQTSNSGVKLEDVLRVIFGGGNSAGQSGGKGTGNGDGRSFGNAGGNALNNGGSRDTGNGGGWGGNSGGGWGGNSGGGRGVGNVGGTNVGSGGGKGIRDGDLFGDGGFGGSKGSDGRSKSGDNLDLKNFNNQDDLFLFSS